MTQQDKAMQDHLLQIIGTLTVKLDLTERNLARKTAECEQLHEADAKRLQEEMNERNKAVLANGVKAEAKPG